MTGRCLARSPSGETRNRILSCDGLMTAERNRNLWGDVGSCPEHILGVVSGRSRDLDCG